MRQHCLSREQWPQPAEACFNDASSQVWNTAALPRCLKLCGSSRSSWNREAITVCPDSWAAAQPKIERHRNQALGSSVSRRLADILSSFTQPPSCKVQLREGNGVRSGEWNKWACALTCKALLFAVNVDLERWNRELRLVLYPLKQSELKRIGKLQSNYHVQSSKKQNATRF